MVELRFGSRDAEALVENVLNVCADRGSIHGHHHKCRRDRRPSLRSAGVDGLIIHLSKLFEFPKTAKVKTLGLIVLIRRCPPDS